LKLIHKSVSKGLCVWEREFLFVSERERGGGRWRERECKRVYACRWIENGYIEIQTDRWIDWNIKRHGEGKQKQTTSNCNWNLLTSTLFLFFANQNNTTKKNRPKLAKTARKIIWKRQKRKKKKTIRNRKRRGKRVARAMCKLIKCRACLIECGFFKNLKEEPCILTEEPYSLLWGGYG